MFSCDFGVNFSELLKYDIIECPIHVLFECDTVIIIQNKINIVRLHKWVIIKIHTFSCSYFGDIKYFRSRFALAY